MPRKKSKPTLVGKNQANQIKVTDIEEPQKVSFSYLYYQNDHPKFSIAEKDAKYFQTFLNRLHDLSRLTVQELLSSRSKSLRCHPIDWNDTTESGFGIPREEELVTPCPYQFQVSSNEHGRVHGFFIENVFYIVWLDPDHNLYGKK